METWVLKWVSLFLLVSIAVCCRDGMPCPDLLQRGMEELAMEDPYKTPHKTAVVKNYIRLLRRSQAPTPPPQQRFPGSLLRLLPPRPAKSSHYGSNRPTILVRRVTY